MDIYFDCEPVGDPEIDSHLMEILLGLKAEIKRKLASFADEIENENGLILIIIKPGKWGFKTENLNPILFEKVNVAIGIEDFENVIHRISRKDFN